MDVQKKCYIKIRDYINTLFEAAPKTKAAIEMKEEMIGNAEEKLTDLLADGYQEEDALSVVINSIGNVDELFADLERLDFENPGTKREEYYKKKAMLTTIAVGIYIFAGAVFFGLAMVGETFPIGLDLSAVGMVLAIIICIIPTCMLVYISMLAPAYRKSPDNTSEDHPGFHSSDERSLDDFKTDDKRDRAIRRAVESILWTTTVLIYLAVSFLTFRWEITWMIFIIAVCLDSIVNLIFSLKKK